MPRPTESDREWEHQPTHRLVPRREVPWPAPEEADLFDQPPEPIPPAPPPPPIVLKKSPTIEDRFQRFLVEQPEVVYEFIELARKAKAAGRRRVSGKLLIEVIRWGMFIEHDRTLKINNVVTSRLVRHVQEQNPDIADLFETRELLSK